MADPSNVRCALCGKPINTKALNVFQKKTGWAQNRGATGGANAIRLAVPHDEWAHPECVDMESHKINARQGTLV